MGPYESLLDGLPQLIDVKLTTRQQFHRDCRAWRGRKMCWGSGKCWSSAKRCDVRLRQLLGCNPLSVWHRIKVGQQRWLVHLTVDRLPVLEEHWKSGEGEEDERQMIVRESFCDSWAPTWNALHSIQTCMKNAHLEFGFFQLDFRRSLLSRWMQL